MFDENEIMFKSFFIFYLIELAFLIRNRMQIQFKINLSNEEYLSKFG